MRYVADLHIHSCYSRATAVASHLHGLAAWAAIKGIDVIGTGDFTHPQWFEQLTNYLEEAEAGFYRLKNPDEVDVSGLLPPGVQPDLSRVRFVLSAEISSIYKRGGKVRKVHNILYAPNLEAVRRISSVLAGIGNLESDGRPILGLDSHDLLEIMLENSPDGFLVPAHIWTPWFSLFGSKSGFDSIEECYGELSEHIFALETGLSSDPDMNRRISALDRFTLISNSDCHSPGKLGREANIFETDFDYYSMREAIRNPVDRDGVKRFAATVEFFPEEGKYHCDGHRKCGICFDPLETSDYEGICPECGRPLTIGVLSRVKELADRKTPHYPEKGPEVYSLVPLTEVLGEILGVGPASKKVMTAYGRVIREFGSEFNVLLNAPIAELSGSSTKILGEAIRRVRSGEVIRQAGYDGEFGVIKVFSTQERLEMLGQMSLFGVPAAKPRVAKKKLKKKAGPVIKTRKKKSATEVTGLNPEQEASVVDQAQMVAVQAGPGTGKTHTLVERVVRTARSSNGPCTVITFTNKAADEVGLRIGKQLDPDLGAQVFTATFHSFCLHWLRKENSGLEVAGPETRIRLLRINFPGKGVRELRKIEQTLARYLADAWKEDNLCPQEFKPYFKQLRATGLLDIDEVIAGMVSLLRQGGEVAEELRKSVGPLFVDEFQDVNPVQYELVRLLAQTSPVFVIGDPDQAIYGFRGADSACFGYFIEEFKPNRHLLRENYRSAKTIVSAAYEVIGHNPRMDDEVDVRPMRHEEGKIFVHNEKDEVREAIFIALEVERLLGGISHLEMAKMGPGGDHAFSFSDIGILYRTTKQADQIAEQLGERGIPYQVVDTQPFYMKGETYILYLWSILAAGGGDMVMLLHLLEGEKKVGAKSVAIAERLLATGVQPTFSFLLDALSALTGYPAPLRAALQRLEQLRQELILEIDQKGLTSGLHFLVSLYGMNGDSEEVARFMRLAASHGSSLPEFATHLQRYQDSVVYDERAEAVNLLTLHAAKGLEFPVVFIAGVEEELLPLSVKKELSPEEQKKNIQEERRLFFVGMTRAIRYLYLTHVSKRLVYGKKTTRHPSRFLEEIPIDLTGKVDPYGPGKKKRKPVQRKQLSLF